MGCSCNLKYFSEGFTGNDLLQDTKLRETLSDYKMINKQAFKAGDVLEIMKYFSCVDKDQFYGMFANIGINLEPTDLPNFAQVIAQGGDKGGWINGTNGLPVIFDGMKMLREMKFTKQQVSDSQCTIDFY